MLEGNYDCQETRWVDRLIVHIEHIDILYSYLLKYRFLGNKNRVYRYGRYVMVI